MSVRTRWLIVAPASVVVGYLFSRAHIPAAWILAAILVSGAMALRTGEDLPVSKHFYRISRGFIGIIAAVPLTMVPGRVLLEYLPAGILMALITSFVGITGGVLVHRAQPRDVSWETGILSMLPGGASTMPALADELGADYRYVALVQYLRLLAVSVSLPLVVAMLTTPHHGLSPIDHPHSPWWVVLLTLAIAFFGEKLGRLLRLPAAAVLGPLLVTVATAAAFQHLLADAPSLEPLYVFRVMAFLSIGWVCGGGLNMRSLRSFAKQLPATVLFIVAVIGVCAASAWPLTHWLHISYFEAYLATSPGALETVLALSAEGGAGPAVVAMQLIRLIVVLLIAGYLPQILGFFRRRRRS